MIGPIRTPAQQLVTVFGGTGFLGRHVVQALARRGYRVRVATRRPDRAFFLQPLGGVGQICAVQANLRDPASVARAVAGADHVVNLVGILQEGGRQTFDDLQANGPRLIAELRRADDQYRPCVGNRRQSPIAIRLRPLEGRGRGGGVPRPAGRCRDPAVIVVRVGRQLLQSLRRAGPAFAHPARSWAPIRACSRSSSAMSRKRSRGPSTARCRAGAFMKRAALKSAPWRRSSNSCSTQPSVGRFVLSLPNSLGRMMGSALGFLDKMTLGVLPDELVMTRDQAIMLETDNVVSEEAIAEGRTLAGNRYRADRARGHRAVLSHPLPPHRPVRPEAQFPARRMPALLTPDLEPAAPRRSMAPRHRPQALALDRRKCVSLLT